ncbi:MAG: hypothetical protein HYY32_04030 [Chloroflexi bacterium]|nr:hypothetical protein [Chloroflexota bacterium]
MALTPPQLHPAVKPASAILFELFQRLLAAYGPQHWWPGETPFEVTIGAILTQSTAWKNVERAIASLKLRGLLDPGELRRVPVARLAEAIRPSGYYNVKAKKLKAMAAWLGAQKDSFAALSRRDIASLRLELLSIWGVGEETADSVLLYACNKPVFVVDAYTRRIMARLGLLPPTTDYAGCQALFMNNLPRHTGLYNEYHALLVVHGKSACKTDPVCRACVLASLCPQGNRC